ncbi:MAG: rod shape-determining protein MreD [Elusimicrobiales bacterium]|nr:rod shape-determining protein MreD [Elusimicrobiales bacterium]
MRTPVEIICWILLCVFYSWQGKYLSIYGVSPDWLFVTVVASAAFSSRVRGSTWAFVIGLYADILGGGAVGANALIYTLSAWIVQIVAQRFDFFDRLTQVVVLFLFSWPVYLAGWLLAALFSHDAWFSVKQFCAVPFLNAIAAPFVFFVMLEIKSFFRFYEKN